MRIFKKIILIVTLVLTPYVFVFGKQASVPLSLLKNELSYLTDTIFNWNSDKSIFYTQEDIISLVEEYVPERYIDTFLCYTECVDKEFQKILRLHILSMGIIESRWEENTVNRKNRNKTVDRGFIQVNSINYTNKDFVIRFMKNKEQPASFYNYKPFNQEEKYLILGINYYRFLYDYCRGSDAMLAYNGGIGNYERNEIPNSSYRYRFLVKREYCKLLGKLDAKVLERKETPVQKSFVLICEKKDYYQQNSTKDKYELFEMYVFGLKKNQTQFTIDHFDKPKKFFLKNKKVYFG